ncbi:MAG: DUF2254 domain-containing protein [Betaproteobacteria bacterium]|jgi:uncharacterized membrane protein|nr:DUF2254 domain-containing protein [Betaproteobacteria bacterium]
MRTHLLRLWLGLRTSYWFIPGLLAVVAAALAATLIAVDVAVQGRELAGLGRFAMVGPDGARTLLSTIASAAITVAALVFSITMVVLNMASAQFGPRLLPNFMRQKATQLVMGVFVGTFLYCLLTLAAVTSESGRTFVPQFAVAGGLLLGVLAFMLLIYLFHHVSVFVQAARIIDDVASDLEQALQANFPERLEDGQRTPDDEATEDDGDSRGDEEQGHAIAALRSGYVEAVDTSGLVALASKHGILIELGCRPGHFVYLGRPLAHAGPAAKVNEALAAEIAGAIVTGPERTSAQDPEFAVHQLVEVAVRALSPGINDPYTALNCIDRLAAALCLLAGRDLPSRYLRDAKGRVRLVTDPYTYGGVVDAAFNQIRQAAHGHLAVLLRLLEAVAEIARGDLPEPFREALRTQAEAIRDSADGQFPARADRAAFDERVRAAFAALDEEH